MFKWIAKLLGSETATLSPYQEAILLFKGSQLRTDSVYRDFSKLPTMLKSIETYVSLISEAIDSLENKRLFRSLDHITTQTAVDTQRFFLSENGHYLSNVTNTHRDFIEMACLLLELYERKINDPDIAPVEQANQLRILPIINNLMMLSVVLGEDQTQ